MSLLYWFESIRTPALTAVMSLVTRLGEETVFMALGLFVFWCVDKRRGYCLLSVGFLGTLANQWLKIVCRAPRPWVRDPDFTPVASAVPAAGGYSFPSGHAQCAAGSFGVLAWFDRRVWRRVLWIALALLVAVSRMYLGVHTPADVGASLALAAVLVPVLCRFIEGARDKPGRMYGLFAALLAGSLAFAVWAELFPFPADVDAGNLAEAVKNAWSLAGAMAGMLAAYAFDERRLRFSTGAPPWGQAVKLILGLALTVALKSLLKEPLLSLFGGAAAAHGLRYLIVVLFAGCLWPMSFRFFDRAAGAGRGRERSE